ncbi:MFS transporter [Sphingomonas sp. So64.6b]|uniref:MFS transporter n=1 Tax=Sphingomonas sp. So64.6b TaxID=2997354 RepID=UPI001601F166|nr:MFS transporter [Sphingomonas sp. So64.6b]QNA86510.1 MFS transporter [Sphingomonas sp. So64.6b]
MTPDQPSGGQESGSGTIDVAQVIERQRMNGFVIRLVAISWIVTMFDGFDMLVLSFLAPYIRHDFGIGPVQLGQLFGCGTVGAMIGGIGFGWLGDRMGRRPTIILSVFAFGLSSMALAFAGSIETLMALRFLNGVALGGLMPLAWALNIEFVPARFRATVVTLIMMGYTLGGAIAGPLTVWVAPHWGWHSVFLLSGIVTMPLVVLLFFLLPESARFLAVKRRAPGQIARSLNAIERGLGATAATIFLASDEKPATGSQNFNLSTLFEGSLRAITPLLWLAYIGSSLAIYFKTSWGPILFEDVGFTRTEAAYIASVTSIGGAIAGLALMRFTDRMGPIAIALFPLLAVPLLLLMGLADIARPGFAVLSVLSMTMIGGAHFGMHSIAGLFYPSAIRANGAGWATSVAKIGSIAAPLLGGYLLAANLPPRQLFVLLAVAPAVCAVALMLLGRAFSARRDRAAALEANAVLT